MSREPHPTHLFGNVGGERLCVGCWCAPHDGMALDFCAGLSLVGYEGPVYRRLAAHIRSVNGGKLTQQGSDHAGRKTAINREQAAMAWDRHVFGDTGSAIAADLGVSRRALYRAWARWGFTNAEAA